MEGLTLHWQVAEPALESAYRQVSRALAASDFYLAGGTALALQEGHRISVDLDLMSPSFDDSEGLIQDLRSRGLAFEVTMTAPRTLYLEVGGVQVSLLGYRYPLLETAIDPGEGLLPLAHRDDIAAMKLAAITSRGSRKDFIDLWLLVTRHRPLGEYLDLFSRKFEERDVGHVVRSLTYFDDAEAEPSPRMLMEIPWERLRADFLGWVSELLPG